MTNPIAFDADGPASVRFPTPALDDVVLARLQDVCAVDTARPSAVAAGRDWWPLALLWARQGEAPALPAVVARPSTAADVAAVLAVCNEARVPVTAGGGRSGVCGGVIPVHGGIALDTTALAGIVDVDDASLLVDVGAGTFGDAFEASLREEHGLTSGHWPQSMALSTVGGWVACRSAGQYSTRYGKIEDMTVGLEVVLADGTVVRMGGAAPRAATGPDLGQLFLGSEGTLGVVTAATLRVHPAPVAERRGAWGFDDFPAGLDACRRILRRGATPAVLRLYDDRESRRSFDVEGMAALIVLDEGDPAAVDAVMHVVEEECRSAAVLDGALVGRWLEHRNDVSGLGAAIESGFVVDTCEVAGRWSVLPDLYRDAVAAVKAVEGTWTASAHQSHAYTDGACLYFTFAGQPAPDDAERYYRDAWDALTQATLGHGAAISHHHGVGLNRDRFMAGALGTGLDVLRTVKDALDPHGILNPGKLGLPSKFGPPVWP
jgi:alkyldihydroxyacetonephosphate synthase